MPLKMHRTLPITNLLKKISINNKFLNFNLLKKTTVHKERKLQRRNKNKKEDNWKE